MSQNMINNPLCW